MNELEQKVWAAAYAAVYANELNFYKGHGMPEKVCGFNCAEYADEAVRKLREALTSDDGQYLYPITEKWNLK